MSHDNEERDRYLQSNGYSSWDATRAGVNPYDSAETARNKIDGKRERDAIIWTSSDTSTGGSSTSPSGAYSYEPSSSGSSRQISGKGCLLFLLMPLVIMAGVIGWTEKSNIAGHVYDMWRNAGYKKAAAKRIEAFSDFSRIEEWPSRVQETYQKQQDKPLQTLMEEIPEKLKTLSSARKEELGAQIWFKISSKGPEASRYLIAIQTAPHHVMDPRIRAGELSIYFLQHECARGVELACLDAAKSFAGLVWYGDGPFEDGWVNEKALKQLPTSGPLSSSSAIKSLREKIASTLTLPAK